MLLHFAHAQGGLLLKSPGRGAFEIAGADHIWFPAEAHLVNGVVVVSTSLVQQPTAVRYTWSSLADAIAVQQRRPACRTVPHRRVVGHPHRKIRQTEIIMTDLVDHWAF